VKYEDIQREGMMALKPDLFEGMRFELNKPLNPNFFLSHSIFMGNMDLSTGGRQALKTPMGTYEFGANVITEKFMMLGRITTEGRLSGRVKYDLADWVALKLHMQLSNEPGQSQGMLDTDVKVGGKGSVGRATSGTYWQHLVWSSRATHSAMMCVLCFCSRGLLSALLSYCRALTGMHSSS
jgi:hypothetical protein